MCTQNAITKVIPYAYWIVCLSIPLIYILAYYLQNRHRRKKHYAKMFVIATLMLAFLLMIKLIVAIDEKSCLNCYINNVCPEKDVIEEQNTTKKTTKSTSTTTTKKKPVVEKEYAKIPEPTGTKKEIGTSSKGYTIYTIDDVTYVDGYLIANKTYALPEDYEPEDTYKSTKGVRETCNTCINNIAYAAWQEMKADATALGLNIWIQSGYRPYNVQESLYNRYVSRDGKEAADTYSARAGHSEHQSGQCFDLNSITDAFANTNEGKWVAQNAYKYGFIIRYPKGKTDETGYIYESWHLRYVGTDLATELYNDGDWITMEDYFGLTSIYSE